MGLSVNSFFTNYMIHPLSGELSWRDKIKAAIGTVALGILTLGIAQIVCASVRWRTISRLDSEHKIKAMALARLGFQAYTKDTKEIEHALPCGELSFDTMGRELQGKMIRPLYGRRLPPADQVEVTLPEGGRAKWKDLSTEQKIAVNNHHTHPHNRVAPTMLGKLMIDRFFMPGGQEPYLPHDPRESHGCDHAARVAVFVPIFAYLYAKYHPGVSSLTENEVLLAQFIGAGHDSGRQSEGPDVYDEDSANLTIQALKDLGIEDERVYQQARAAIADKDSKDMLTKPLIAKLVQNADSAEFVRLLLSGPVQYQRTFRGSERFLDIFTELSQISQDHKGMLKGDHSFQDFHDELEEVRWEMNRLIFQTHKKEFRVQASQPGKNYYQEILNVITSEQYPLLSRILESMEVKGLSAQEFRHRVEAKNERVVSEVETWLARGISAVPTPKLQQFSEALRQTSPNPQRTKLLAEISAQIEMRSRAEAQYTQLLALPKKEYVRDVMISFSSLPPLLRVKYRPTIKEYFEFLDVMPSGEAASHLLQAEKIYEQLSQELKKDSLKRLLAHANALCEQVTQLLDHMDHIPIEQRDSTLQTACAIALEKAALIFVREGVDERAREALTAASCRLVVDQKHPVMELMGPDTVLSEDGKVVSFPTDCAYIRKHRLRACQRKMDGQRYTELSFELTSQSREQINETFCLLPPSAIQTVPAEYVRRGKGGNSYTHESPMIMGKDLKIQIGENIEIRVGAEKGNWNEYHLMRIRVREGTSPQEVHAALASIGLPTALMTPREEDKHVEALSRILSFRFPSLMPAGDPDKDPFKVYSMLSLEQREAVDADLAAVHEALVGPMEVEQVLPTVEKKAWEYGARALGTFIWAGDIKSTASVALSVLKNGFLSSEERFQRGILGLGCVPALNYEAGSGNQVFTRILTKHQIDSRYSLDHFPVSGPIFFILDLQALERMPYSYLEDRAGVRNPEFRRSPFLAQKQAPISDFVGSEMIAQRLGFEEGLKAQERTFHPLNEVMFDLTLGPQYIRQIVVGCDEDRQVVLKTLKEARIFEVNGVPIDYCVVVSRCLHPGLVPGSDEPEPYLRESKDDLKYL